jgi:hypothetical protein
LGGLGDGEKSKRLTTEYTEEKQEALYHGKCERRERRAKSVSRAEAQRKASWKGGKSLTTENAEDTEERPYLHGWTWMDRIRAVSRWGAEKSEKLNHREHGDHRGTTEGRVIADLIPIRRVHTTTPSLRIDGALSSYPAIRNRERIAMHERSPFHWLSRPFGT